MIAATDVMMNINSNGNGSSNVTGERHRYRSVNQDIKEGLGLNVTSSLYHYPPPYRQVKRRRRLTEEETNILNNIFENVQKPDATTRAQLAQKLNMSSRAIQVWFQNRRAKVKRDALESRNAAKNNVPKKLTLIADYCPEKMKQRLYSLSLSPLPNSTLTPSSTKNSSISNSCTGTSRITPNLANLSIALTTNLCTSFEEQKLDIPIHVNRNDNSDMDGLIQYENVDYWNASYLKSLGIDDQSAFYSLYDSCNTNEQKFEVTPLLALPCFPEQSLNQTAQDDSCYNISSLTPLNNTNLLNMSNTLNTDYSTNNNRTSTWLIDMPQKTISTQNNIIEPQYDYLTLSRNSQNDRHLPLFSNYMLPAARTSINEAADVVSTIKQPSSAVLSFKQLSQQYSQDSYRANDDNESITTNGTTSSLSSVENKEIDI